MRYHNELPEHAIERTGSSEFKETHWHKSLEELFEKFDQANWDRCCRTMQLHVMHDHEQAAIDTLKKYLRNRKPPIATVKTSLACLLEARIANALDRVGIKTVEQAIATNDTQLMSINGFRGITIRKIRDACQAVLRGEAFGIERDDV